MKIKIEVELDTEVQKDAALLQQLIEILEEYKEGYYDERE